jgi:hypothetical protein
MRPQNTINDQKSQPSPTITTTITIQRHQTSSSPFNIITSPEIIIIINVPPNLSVTNEESTEATMNNRYDSLFSLLAETQAVVTLRLCSSVQIHCVCKQFSIHLFILCPIPISVSIQSKFILTVTTCFWNSNNTFKLMQELDKFMQDVTK